MGRCGRSMARSTAGPAESFGSNPQARRTGTTARKEHGEKEMTKNVTPHWNWRTIKSAVETTAQPCPPKASRLLSRRPPCTHGAPACAFAEADAAVTESGRMREHDCLGDGVHAALDEAGQIWLRTQ